MRVLLSFVVLTVLLATGMVAIGAHVMPRQQSRAAAPAPAVMRSPAPVDRSVRLPPADGALDYQLGGPYSPAQGVDVVVRDWHTSPARGRYGVCYVDVFQTQPEAAAWWTRHHPDLLLRRNGVPVEDPNWPRQYLLDTSSPSKRDAIVRIERRWVEACADRGYDALEADNLDSWTRSHGAIRRADNLELAMRIVRIAHRQGLAVAQKNAATLGARRARAAGFDFAVVESCQAYRECAAYTAVYGRRVYEIEYDPAQFRKACSARGERISVTLRDRMVVPRNTPGHVFDVC